MKDNHLILKSLVVSALMGVGTAAQASAPVVFTPLEALAPEQRAVFVAQLEALAKEIQIDWSSVVAGVDENGKLVLRARSEIELREGAQPSCFGRE